MKFNCRIVSSSLMLKETTDNLQTKLTGLQSNGEL